MGSAGRQQQRIAIRSGCFHKGGGDLRSRARTVLHHERLIERLLQFLRNHA